MALYYIMPQHHDDNGSGYSLIFSMKLHALFVGKLRFLCDVPFLEAEAARKVQSPTDIENDFKNLSRCPAQETQCKTLTLLLSKRSQALIMM